MQTSKATLRLILLIAVLTLVAGLAGLFLGGGDGPATFTTLHGEQVTLYGHGLYRADPLLSGSGARGQDAVVLGLGLPLLLAALGRYRTGSWRGGLLLAGTLAYLLYVSASLAFGAAYNPLFAVYVTLFSASLFGLTALLTSLVGARPPREVTANLPRRAASTFLFVVGAVLLIVWGGLSLLPALLTGGVPAELGSSTTLVTHALDLGVIVPVSLLTGVLLRREAPLGDVLAPTLLVLSGLMGLTITASTVAQALAGYPYTAAQVLTLVLPFVLLALAGLWLALKWWGHLPGTGERPQLA